MTAVPTVILVQLLDSPPPLSCPNPYPTQPSRPVQDLPKAWLLQAQASQLPDEAPLHVAPHLVVLGHLKDGLWNGPFRVAVLKRHRGCDTEHNG